ncbi:MAG TPA: BMP family ABC transporter substrate-binding protein [Candidatus Choladousia intestinavium]|uniref:BMP family ABC transporter substrate-binding protein n=1 Tax=Candidatus Choladousia intestinavium TaxID=2840727 RepID=A0A9D1ACL2_9FIRM|nr:BMP family ABC transporter substrate-binding protein [Candidatus Choladousia intestinavium]
MKKKCLSLLLTGAMVLSAISFGMVASAEEDTIKVGMVTDVGGVNDGSFNQSSWEGLQRASEELGIEVDYLESSTDADYATNIETFIDGEYDLIICVGYMLADATRAAAEDYPEQKFAIIDDATCSDLENVTCLMFEQAQASYLVGYVAGLTTESNTVGFVLGMSTDTMNQFGYGYLAGVLDANPEATVLQQNANSFSDTATGKSMATAEITGGADVIFHAAGATGLGVIEACTENGIWAIGVDSDQSSIAPETILTSAMKRVDNACYDVAQQCLEGTLESGVITYDLASEGVDIAPTTDNLSDDVLEAVNEVKEQIINGDIVVPSTQEDFEAAYGDIYELD